MALPRAGFFAAENALASALSNDSRHLLDAGPFSVADHASIISKHDKSSTKFAGPWPRAC